MFNMKVGRGQGGTGRGGAGSCGGVRRPVGSGKGGRIGCGRFCGCGQGLRRRGGING